MRGVLVFGPAGSAEDEPEIPLSARIVALVDVYDALATRRVYKPAYEPEVAKEIIVREAGAQFDPAIVDAFLARFDDLLEVTSGENAKRRFLTFQGDLARSTTLPQAAAAS
jgi:putative two-component system response regulator